ncbi:hypothetical protein [Corynebacterium bovis]|uniref:hypothetical protein n=1 Tax=Corynebacterium bovis TaxID=36808 RepID=UPI000F6473D0|nr:hypothetical protein [Corynebacterium bovis]
MTNLTFRSRPDVSRRRRAWILAGVGAAGVGVAGLSAGTAGADPVTDQAVVPGPTGVADPLAAAAATAGQIADTVGDMARAAGIPVPGPITPDAPGGQAAQAVLPTTLLRRDESAETAPQTTPAQPVAAGGPAGGADDGTSAPQFAPGAVTTARAAAGDADAAAQVGRGVTKAITDPSVIGDVISAIDAPTGWDIDQTIKQTSQAITDVVTGKALADAQAAIDRTLSGPEFADWANNTANAFAARTGNGWERAADGVAAAIDHITRDPAGFIGQAVVEGGGVARLATDPAGFARQVVEKIAGPDILADIDVVIGEYVVPSLIDAVRAAAPAALIPAAAFLPGFVAGTGLAAPWTSGLGAAAGALNPLAHLVGLATSLLGAPLGALATGLPGFLASALMTLPIALMAPLLGAAAGSALALAGWASLVYGAWAATLIPVGVAAIGLGGLAGVLAGGALMAISGLNPIMVPAAIAGGVLTFLFVATMIVGGYTLATVLIPTIIYLLGVSRCSWLGRVWGSWPV